MSKVLLKSALRVLLGDRNFTRVISRRSRNYQLRLLREHGLLERSAEFCRIVGPRVLHGPFTGMKYPQASVVSRNAIPQLLGAYELELHPCLLGRHWADYNAVLDI